MSETNTVSPLRQRMIEDMAARKLNPHTQRSHIYSCKRFAAWLKRSPDTATVDEVRRFQLHLVEDGASICNRNRIMTGVRFLFRVTLAAPRRPNLPATSCPGAFWTPAAGARGTLTRRPKTCAGTDLVMHVELSPSPSAVLGLKRAPVVAVPDADCRPPSPSNGRRSRPLS